MKKQTYFTTTEAAGLLNLNRCSVAQMLKRMNCKKDESGRYLINSETLSELETRKGKSGRPKKSIIPEQDGFLTVYDDISDHPEFVFYDCNNLKDIFGRCEGHQTDFDTIEQVFAQAKNGITFTQLKKMIKKYETL